MRRLNGKGKCGSRRAVGRLLRFTAILFFVLSWLSGCMTTYAAEKGTGKTSMVESAVGKAIAAERAAEKTIATERAAAKTSVAAMAAAEPITEPAASESGAKAAEVSLDLDQYDLSEIQRYIDRQASNGWNLSFGDMMKDIMDGRLDSVMGQIGTSIKDNFFSEVRNNSHMMGQIIILGIIGAVFTNFSNVFTGSQISETGFFVTYLLLFTYLAASFFTSITVAGGVVSQILDFMKALMPAFFLAAAFAGGSVSAVASYEFTLIAITAAQAVAVSVLLPMTKVYALLVMAGHVAKEDILSKLTELLASAISWSLKTMVGIVLGFHLIQGLVLPYVDSMKTGAVQKIISVIPGIGNGANAVASMVIGSGVLVKNTMGAAGVVILLIITVIPMVKLVILMILYQCVAAVLQPVCDKRIVSCISDMAKGHKILLSIASSAILLFVVTIAMVCASTNVLYYTG